MKSIFGFFGKKNFKFSLVALIMAFAMIAMTFIVNYGAGQFNIKWDMTANQIYSIGDQTKTILQGLNKDVEMIVLDEKARVALLKDEILQKYGSFPRIKLKYVDPDTNTNIVRELDKDNLLDLKKGDIVIKSANKIKKVSDYEIIAQDNSTNEKYFVGEHLLSGTIKYVSSDKTPTIYFLEGHGERDIDTEFYRLKSIFESSNYAVKTVNLTISEKMPEDAEILICAGPKTDLLEKEKDKILEYMQNGGNSIFLLDPVNSNNRFTQFESILEKFNMGLNYDKVMETDNRRHVSQIPDSIIPDVPRSELTQNIDLSSFMVYIPSTRSFKLLDNKSNTLNVFPLLTASASAVGEAFGGVQTENNNGPLDIAYAGTDTAMKDSKLVAFGSSYFITDKYYQEYGAASQFSEFIFLRCIGWVRDNTNDVFIEPKTMLVTDSAAINGSQARNIVIGTAFGIPLLITILGITIWLRRRHL